MEIKQKSQTKESSSSIPLEDEKSKRVVGIRKGIHEIKNAYERHMERVHNMIMYRDVEKWKKEREEKEKQDLRNYKTDEQVLKEHYQFVRDPEEDEKDIDESDYNDYVKIDERKKKVKSQTWEQRYAMRYEDKLYKEYCLADLSKFKEHKMGLRWRAEREVMKGKGEMVCGEVKCDERLHLMTFEVNFAYKEQGVQKNALVKLRLCPTCSKKLKKVQKHERKAEKRKRDSSESAQEESESTSTEQNELEKAKKKLKRLERELWKRQSEPQHDEQENEQQFDDFFKTLE